MSNLSLNSNLSSDYPVSGFSDYSGSSNKGQADKRLKKFKFPLTSWIVEKGIKLVVFDKDGTLIEFQNYCVSGPNQLLAH